MSMRNGAYTLIAMNNSYLSPKEICARWGLHSETIRRLIRAGKLPAIYIGRLIRVRVSDLEAFENSQRTSTKPANKT